MAVKRIVADIKTADPSTLKAFYTEVFDLEVAMDQGWIITLATKTTGPVQISFASEGGSGTDVPDLSLEVDNLDEVYARVKVMGCDIPYALTAEPWGVRRFYVTDPAGKVLNVLSHT